VALYDSAKLISAKFIINSKTHLHYLLLNVTKIGLQNCRLWFIFLLFGVFPLYKWILSFKNWHQTIKMFSFSHWMWMKLR